jgi:Protein of unknown function (DUF3320)
VVSAISEPDPLERGQEPESDRLYAEAFPNPMTVQTVLEVYRTADLAEVATPDRTRFYDVAYRSELRTMVDYVIAVEGPVYFHACRPHFPGTRLPARQGHDPRHY